MSTRLKYEVLSADVESRWRWMTDGWYYWEANVSFEIEIKKRSHTYSSDF